MADEAKPSPAPAGGAAPDRYEELVRGLGMVVSNSMMYGPAHGVTRRAMTDCYAALTSTLEGCGEFAFSMSEDSMMVNNVTIDQRNPLVRGLNQHLTARDAKNFAILRGITEDQFTKFVAILLMKPDALKTAGGLSGALMADGIESVRAAKISYVQVTDTDVVVSKDALEEAIGGQVDVEKLVSFLRKEPGSLKSEDILAAVQGSEEPAKMLGDAILDAVENDINADTGDGAAVDIPGKMIDYVQRIYETLSDDPSLKTQKGKKQLTKMLDSIQDDLLNKLATMCGGEADPEVAARLHEAVEEMTDDLTIDALAAEYMKKRGAIDQSERRILRFIKAKGVDKIKDTELRDRLNESGLTPEGWRELLAKTGIFDVGSFETVDLSGVNVVEHIAALLTHVKKAVDEKKAGDEGPGAGAGAGAGAGEGEGAGAGDGGTGAGGGTQELSGVLTQINQEVGQVMDKATRRIDDVIKEFQNDEKRIRTSRKPDDEPVKLTRKRLMIILGEIGQELCQPLAVISCSVDMLLSNALGEMNESQVDMLNLAVESSFKLKQLSEKLMQISGLPETMSPDADIQQSLYR